MGQVEFHGRGKRNKAGIVPEVKLFLPNSGNQPYLFGIGLVDIPPKRQCPPGSLWGHMLDYGNAVMNKTLFLFSKNSYAGETETIPLAQGTCCRKEVPGEGRRIHY